MTYGAVVVLCGPVNSGKSTLFNSLVGSNRAIVNREPGTTRDLLEAMIIIDGVPITLVDTAGLREASNDIEIEGVRRARDYIKKADLVFVVNDITVGITSMESIDNTLFKDNNIVNIYNKTDLLSQKDIKKCRSVFKPGLFTSALTGVGLGKLKNHIITALDLESNTGENFGITTTRQYNAILKSDAAMAAVIEIAEQYPLQLELVSFELQNALNSIEDLLGTKTADEVLNNMFDSFCVGK